MQRVKVISTSGSMAQQQTCNLPSLSSNLSLCSIFREWCSLVASVIWNHVAAGSNPASLTKHSKQGLPKHSPVYRVEVAGR